MRLILSTLLILCSLSVLSQDFDGRMLFIGAKYRGDFVTNVQGGIKRGRGYMGMARLNIGLNTRLAGLENGGIFYVDVANTHGATPSVNLIGDIQIASNIEAGSHIFFQELWYKHLFNKFELTIGLQELSNEIANVENSSILLNNSFGILPIISMNLDAPIFPLTSIGLTLKWNVSDKISWYNVIFDGRPNALQHNPYNISWEFRRGDGAIIVSEVQYNSQLLDNKGTYKLGFFLHDHFIERTFIKDFPDSLNISVSGIFLLADQQLWSNDDVGVGLFFQTGFSRSMVSLNKFYLGSGIRANGFLSRNNSDVLSLGLAYALLKDDLGDETAIELAWRRNLSRYFFVQPDIQYIINPSGNKSGLSNALVMFFRLGLQI